MGREHPLYTTWEGMNQRCRNPNHKAFPRYGGRGIEVCDRWRSFANFALDMGCRPAGMTLDRIDNNGHYSPDNCQWVTPSAQLTNTRLRTDNASGLRGVFWFARTNRWMVYINRQNKRYDLGYYTDFFEACCVRKSAELALDIGGFAESVRSRLATQPNAGNFKWRQPRPT